MNGTTQTSINSGSYWLTLILLHPDGQSISNDSLLFCIYECKQIYIFGLLSSLPPYPLPALSSWLSVNLHVAVIALCSSHYHLPAFSFWPPVNLHVAVIVLYSSHSNLPVLSSWPRVNLAVAVNVLCSYHYHLPVLSSWPLDSQPAAVIVLFFSPHYPPHSQG